MINAGVRGCLTGAWMMGLLGLGLGVSTPAIAAEVKPIAVEVVGSGEVTSIADTAAAVGPKAPLIPVPPQIQDQLTHDQHMGEMFMDMLIPVLAILLIFGGPIVMVIVIAVLRYRARARREKMQSENIARLLEAGRDVPLELLQGVDERARTAENNLRKGITNLGVGVGLTVFLILFLGVKIGSVGFILIGLGLSQLALWKLVDSKKSSGQKNHPIV